MCLNVSPIKAVAHPLIFGLMMRIIVCIHMSILHKKILKKSYGISNRTSNFADQGCIIISTKSANDPISKTNRIKTM